jgi:CheY-like chemotaxis protein
MDGWQTMAALKQGPDTRDIPIIIVSVLSAQETESSQAESSQAEIAGWVRKPLDETALTRALERTIGTPARAPRVLLVEDDPALARVVMTMFEEHGIQVIHAQSGREAIEASQNANPDLLILDVGLPEGDGFDVVKWLRQQDRMARVPLVIYTAKDLDASDRERLTLGVTEFLTKCRVSPEEFERRVIRLLHHVMPEIGAPVRATPGNATKS